MGEFWSQPIVIAAERAVAGGLVMAGAGYFGALENHLSQNLALTAAGAAFFGYLALRAGIEGLVDQSRK